MESSGSNDGVEGDVTVTGGGGGGTGVAGVAFMKPNADPGAVDSVALTVGCMYDIGNVSVMHSRVIMNSKHPVNTHLKGSYSRRSTFNFGIRALDGNITEQIRGVTRFCISWFGAQPAKQIILLLWSGSHGYGRYCWG